MSGTLELPESSCCWVQSAWTERLAGHRRGAIVDDLQELIPSVKQRQERFAGEHDSLPWNAFFLQLVKEDPRKEDMERSS